MTDPHQPTLRLAPSPTGYLHLGHAYSALLNADLAQRFGGRLLLRIEDIDGGRSRPEFIKAILEDLTWLGITWDGPVLMQSDRLGYYQSATQPLIKAGLLYTCGATRREITEKFSDVREGDIARDPEGAALYAPICGRNLNGGTCPKSDRPHAKRIAMDRALAHLTRSGLWPLDYQAWDGYGHTQSVTANPARWGDAVLVRKETPTSYHLASVLDDAEQGVTHIVRGADIAPATDLHVLLQALLGLPTPVYHHHRLILGMDGKKLSKSNGSLPIRQMRADGATPATIREHVGLGRSGNGPK